MQKNGITKTINLDRSIILTIEKIAKAERRSFTRQVEIILESALEREKQAREPGKETA
jgi:hypothetical protein